MNKPKPATTKPSTGSGSGDRMTWKPGDVKVTPPKSPPKPKGK